MPQRAQDRDQDDVHGMSWDYNRSTLWIPLLLLLLAVFLGSAPFTVDYSAAGPRVEEITAARGLAPVESRALAMTVSDVVSALALVGFALLSMNPGRVWARWAACLVGVWLLFAPVVLWAPSASAYLTDTLVGITVIAVTILVPMMPGMVRVMQDGPTTPPGWSYNPSSWPQRIPIIALGWVGFFFSRYLAAYQLGYLDAAVDPFFGNGTMQILESEVSRAWPISDAGLGTTAYAIEALMGYMGGTGRWRTMPWMVSFFGLLVIPLSFTSILLIILQPVSVGTWCTFCLITAVAMLIMIPLTLDEVVAMSQFVLRRRRAGKSLWQVFWKGDTDDGEQADVVLEPSWPAPLPRMVGAANWGMTFPWTLLAAGVVGVWLMAAPAVLGVTGTAADSDHLVGALVVTVAVIATAEIGRIFRWANVALGAWLVVAPFLLSGTTTASRISDIVAGLAVIALSLPRGAILQHYGSAARFIR